MGGLFSRIKVWSATDTLTATDLNNEFNNIINNFIPQEMGSYEATVAQMQTQTSPGNLGTESLAASLAGELAQIRYVLAEITGETLWYQPPETSLATLNTFLGVQTFQNAIVSGLTEASSSQPTFLVASGTGATVTLTASSTNPFSYRVNGVNYVINSNTTLTGLTSAPSSNNTLTINDPLLAGGSPSFLAGENQSTILINNVGSAISAIYGKVAAFQTANSEYMIGQVNSTGITAAFRGYFFNSSSTLVSRAAVSNTDSWSLLTLAWIYVTSGKALTVAYTNPSYQGTAPSSPAAGDYWYNTTLNQWETYTGTTWVVAGATLIGVAIVNSSGNCIGTRSFDAFALNSYSDTNTVEVVTTTLSTTAAPRTLNSQISVYGTTLQLGTSLNFLWSSGTMDSGQTFSANTWYYFYITQTGNPIVSNIAPFDRRNDLRGFYHPAHAWRCVGWAFTLSGVAVFDTSGAESFFRQQLTRPILSSSSSTVGQPYGPQPTAELFEASALGGSFTQMLPPPTQWGGRRMIFQKTDTTFNTITLQAYGSQALSTTCTVTSGGTLATLAASSGLTGGILYLVDSPVFPAGTTFSWSSGTTITLSASVNCIGTQSSVPFVAGIVQGLAAASAGTPVGISGLFKAQLSTQGETLELYSDGTAARVVHRHIPSTWISTTPTITAVTTAPTVSTFTTNNFQYRRVGSNLEFRITTVTTASSTAAGSGVYIWPLPSGVTINTYLVNLNSITSGVAAGTSILGMAYLLIGSGTIFPGSGCYAQASIGVSLYEISTTGSVAPVGSASGGFGNTAVQYNAYGSVPILGWSDANA